MKDFLVGVYIGIGLLAIVAIIFLGIALVNFLASRNIFWTIVEEGKAKAVLKFGQFKRILLVYKGYRVNLSEGEKEGESERERVNLSEGKSEGDIIIEEDKSNSPKSGLKWIGVPFIHSIHRYKFRWVSFEQAEEKGKLVQKTIPHEELIDYILVQDDVYYTFIRESETSDMIPVDVDLLLTIRIVNPYKALFRVQNWLEATLNQLKPVLRRYIASKKLAELINRKEGAAREFEDLLHGAGAEIDTEETGKVDIGDYLERHYGVRIKKVGFVNIDPTGERGKIYQELMSKKWEAERNKEQIMTLAEAEVERLKMVYEKIESFGETGLFIRTLEAIQEAGKGQGNLVIFPFGKLEDLIRGWMGKKTEIERREEK